MPIPSAFAISEECLSHCWIPKGTFLCFQFDRSIVKYSKRGMNGIVGRDPEEFSKTDRQKEPPRHIGTYHTV